jgi:hypothetical protein
VRPEEPLNRRQHQVDAVDRTRVDLSERYLARTRRSHRFLNVRDEERQRGVGDPGERREAVPHLFPT